MDDGVCEVVLTFTSVDKILSCDHSNEISLEVLSCGVICFKSLTSLDEVCVSSFSYTVACLCEI